MAPKMPSKSPLAIAYSFLLLAQIALGITILAVVGNNLWHYNWYGYYGFNNTITYVYGECFMQDSFVNSFHSVCGYAYWVAGLSVAVSLGIAIVQCANGCGSGSRSARCCLPMVSGFMWIWWVVAASVFTDYTHDADSAKPKVPQEHWRHVVVGLAWAEVLLWTLHLLADLAAVGSPGQSSKPDQVPVAPAYPTYPAGPDKDVPYPPVNPNYAPAGAAV